MACTKCRFDVELKSGKPRFIEYKSWSLDGIPNLSTRQFIEYFRSASSIDDLNYVFNKLKTPNIDKVKEKFQLIFGNREKATEIFNSLGEVKFYQLFGVDNIDDFINYVVPIVDGPSSIYRFIKIY